MPACQKESVLDLRHRDQRKQQNDLLSNMLEMLFETQKRRNNFMKFKKQPGFYLGCFFAPFCVLLKCGLYMFTAYLFHQTL